MLKLYTVCACRFDLIELQLQSFKKHLKDEFEFIVFNNAHPSLTPCALHDHNAVYAGIHSTCQDLNIQCIDIQRDDELLAWCSPFEHPNNLPLLNPDGRYKDPGIGNEYSLNWAWQNYISKERDIVIVMHSDVFLLADLKPSEMLQQYDLIFDPQSRQGIREYMWEVFVLLNMAKLPEPETINWMGGLVRGISGDTSVQTSLYLDAHPELRIRRFTGRTLRHDSSLGYSSRPFYEVFLFDGKPAVLHYTSSTNWDRQSAEFHQAKTSWLQNVLARPEGIPETGEVVSGLKCYKCDCVHWNGICPKG
jgi:hypothetical protein